MKTIKPYSDEKLIFNENTNTYTLNRAYVSEELGNAFGDDGVLERRIKKNSRVVYGYIFKVGNTQNRKVVEALINKTEAGRELIFDVLFAQMEADLETGINTITSLPRIDIKTKQVISQQDMADGYMCQQALDILDASAGRIGVNILYAAPYPPQVIMQLKRYLR